MCFPSTLTLSWLQMFMLDLRHLWLFFLFLASRTKYWQWISCTFRDATPKFRSSATTHPNNKNWPIKFNTNHWPPTTRVAIKRLVQETQLWSSRCLSSVEISDRNQTCCNQPLRFKTGRMRVDQRNQLKRMGTNNWLLWSLKNSPKKTTICLYFAIFSMNCGFPIFSQSQWLLRS